MRTHQYGYEPQTGLLSQFRPKFFRYFLNKVEVAAVDFNDRVNPPSVESRKYSRLYQFVLEDEFRMMFHHPVVHLFGENHFAVCHCQTLRGVKKPNSGNSAQPSPKVTHTHEVIQK